MIFIYIFWYLCIGFLNAFLFAKFYVFFDVEKTETGIEFLGDILLWPLIFGLWLMLRFIPNMINYVFNKHIKKIIGSTFEEHIKKIIK